MAHRSRKFGTITSSNLVKFLKLAAPTNNTNDQPSESSDVKLIQIKKLLQKFNLFTYKFQFQVFFYSFSPLIKKKLFQVLH